MQSLSLIGKVNNDQHFGQNPEFRAFYDKDRDSGVDGSLKSNSPSPPNHRATSESDSAAESSIADLDEIVEKFIQYMWQQTKSKSEKKYEFDDLDVVVNWNKIVMHQDDAKFEPKALAKQQPLNQTLFKTYFTNKSNQVQEYSFKTERTTRQSCAFSFAKGFSRGKESGISFKLPNDILEMGGGLRSEQSVACGKDQVNEEDVTWGCDSIIKVGPHSKTSASLVITEMQIERQFCVQTYLKGRLTMNLNHKKDGFVKSLSADISQVLSLANEKSWLPRNSTKFEVIMINNEKVVKSCLYGKCNFRIGVEQHMEISEENLRAGQE